MIFNFVVASHSFRPTERNVVRPFCHQNLNACQINDLINYPLIIMTIICLILQFLPANFMVIILHVRSVLSLVYNFQEILSRQSKNMIRYLTRN